ncbi:NAD(P)-dependent oxidoreductase [Tranquillimonas alkanivorans]|uniref:2-hydroxy-3-oxopropionate reductase n=1 Tax=Tranquillimonas alkanivorans TaxID=441119 RepID=A0A1I5QCG8_9RHOB|nr:NAD(P)-dependent oxidoreductase [Tranquillimonas alkanivorans]SFP43998.1 2-hydroxy-3-oxopropionate reductase [Tranquillimonas alkanivorans]
MAKIGFIGLGLMGSAMVERLQAKGHDLTVIANRSRAKVEAAVGRGATEATTARDLAGASDIVMLCMDTSDSVESRIYGDDGVLAGVREGTIVIDFGTSLPASTLKIGEALAGKGATYLDAPLGRTPAHAVDGKLNIMCAGDEAAYDEVKPVLDELGENVFHLGPLGTGHKIKLINNFFAMTTACAMSEAFAMADAAGVPREKLYGVMSAGPLHSGMMDFVRNYAAEGKIDLAFSVANAAKDVGYYRAMADSLGARSRMSDCAAVTLGEANSAGWDQRMVPEMVDFLAERIKR